MIDERMLAIGEVAERCGVSVSALRHYHELELIEPALRIGGKRRFASEVVGRVNFIRRAQRFGFNLSEIGEILGSAGPPPRAVLDGRLEELRSQQAELQQTIQTLEALRECGCEALENCPAMSE